MKTFSIKDRIKEYFFTNTTEQLRVRQIERKLSLPLPSVIRYTDELLREKILKKEKIANITVFSADRASKEYLLEKKLFNTKMLYNTGLIEFIIETYNNPTILVFGSYNKGEDIETSDIDLCIETPSKKMIKLNNFEKILGRKIQLFIFPSIKSIPNTNLANNIINGSILNGYLEVI